MSDQRSVATDALTTLGTIIDETAARDAIHLAVEPVVAGERLYPGQDVHLNVNDGMAYAAIQAKGLGIVDPFLTGPVFSGQRFWLVVHPRTITSLRHVWSHPAFPQVADAAGKVAESERWLREFAVKADIGYADLLEGARRHIETGEYLCEGGKWEGFRTPDAFWPHYEAVTGEIVAEGDRSSFFTCSCD